MADQTDVKAVTVSGTGALAIGDATPRGVRIKGIYYSMSTAGTVAITDGGSSGATLLSIIVPIGTTYYTSSR